MRMIAGASTSVVEVAGGDIRGVCSCGYKTPTYVKSDWAIVHIGLETHRGVCPHTITITLKMMRRYHRINTFPGRWLEPQYTLFNQKD